jgi:hypothetical protein
MIVFRKIKSIKIYGFLAGRVHLDLITWLTRKVCLIAKGTIIHERYRINSQTVFADLIVNKLLTYFKKFLERK